MNSGIKGFIAGVVLMVVAFLGFQQYVIRTSADDLDYRFFRYIISGTEFPQGYFASGRVITRFLFPVRVKTTFYDAQYNEVTSAEKPGRYGAVVRIALNGGVVTYRYITLYRTPQKIWWGDYQGKVPTIALPPGTGVDPIIERNQQNQIGETIENGFFDSGEDSQQSSILLAGLSETSPSDPEVFRTSADTRNTEWWCELRKRLGLETKYPYLTFLPDGYSADAGKKWPLIVYLHSDNCAGTDMKFLSENELPEHVKSQHIPAIVIAPQRPGNEFWTTTFVSDFIDELLKKYPVDPDRVYLVGSSGGADMTLSMVTLHPERFAAFATVAGDGDFDDVARLKDLPYWAFVGQEDQNVIPSNVTKLVADINKAGGHAHATTYPGTDHGGAWEKAFSDPNLFPWLLAQKRGQPEVITPGVPSP